MLVAFDIGGTFTDIIILPHDGSVHVTKTLSLLDNVGRELAALIDGIAADRNEGVERFVHATTICSNAVIERSVARTGLITTRGFRDVLEMMGQKGPSAYDAHWDRLPPLVPRRLRYEVTERIRADGEIDVPLVTADVERAGERLVRAGVEIIAVCLLNSYLNPAHEEEVKRILGAMFPSIPICLSSDVHPEIREYERTSTTVINSSLVPVVNRYLDKIEMQLRRHRPHLLIMQSNGGTMVATFARERPMCMVESGPAAGVLAAARLATMLDLREVLSFDLGGTSAKACLIEDGKPSERPGTEIGTSLASGHSRGDGHVLRVPSIDIVEVGAGGGSIAWIDQAGALRVGPISAGAEPGPACYGRGGVEPTVTDANVVLGYINPEFIANGTMKIDREEAQEAIKRCIAEPLGLGVLAAAYGIVEVVNATMVRALRAVSTERGHDIRDLGLIAFGGSGPLHAAALSDSVGIKRIIVPPYPGLFSALGLLVAETRLDYIRSLERPLRDLTSEDVRAYYAELERQASDDCLRHGLDYSQFRVDRSVDLRFGFQQNDLTLELPPEALTDPMILDELYRSAHEREYGHAGEGVINVVNLRIRACSADGQSSLSELAGRDPTVVPGNSHVVRDAYFGGAGVIACPVFRREDLAERVPGPLIIEESNSTVVVPFGWSATRDQMNLVLERE